MNASYRWLRDFVDFDLSPAAVADLFTRRCATVDALVPLREIWFREGVTSHSPMRKSAFNSALSSDIIVAGCTLKLCHLDHEYVAFTANLCSRTGIGLPATRL